MRYQIERFDVASQSWAPALPHTITGFTPRNAIERSGLKGRLRAVETGAHWAPHHQALMVKPEGEECTPIRPPRALPSRSRVTSKDREYRSHERRQRRLKVIVTSRPSRLEKNYIEGIARQCGTETPLRHAHRAPDGPGTYVPLGRVVPNGAQLPPVLRHDRRNERTQF